MTTHPFTLKPFGPDQKKSDLQIHGHIQRMQQILSIRYVLQGAVAKVRLAPLSTLPCRQDRLWEQTCFEGFIATDDSAGYWEINLSPAGHWNLYRFEAYRQGMRPEPAIAALPLETIKTANTFELKAAVDLSVLGLGARPLKIALSAVLQTTDHGATYWALTHPGPKPDFHDKKSFLLVV